MKISACWIVKNEADTIAASIRSVINCADELIVVDTGSTDATVRIAEECAARVERFKWTQDFSAARNFALSLVSGDYVLFIDGDEVFSPALCEKDKDAIIGCFERTGADVFQIRRDEIDETGARTGTTIHSRVLRHPGVQYTGRIHELPVLPGGSKPRIYLLSEYRIKHTGYFGDLRMQKAIRNIAILENALQEENEETNLFLYNAYLTREYAIVGNLDKANESNRYLLNQYSMWERLCKNSTFDVIQFLYAAIYIASAQRSLYSRAEVYEKLFMEIKRCYPHSRDAIFADLYYQALFDYREDRFLQMLSEVENRLVELPPSEIAESQQVEALIYSRAASAEYYRRNIREAHRWALASRRSNPNENKLEIGTILQNTENETTFSVNLKNAGMYKDLLSEVGGRVLRGEYYIAYDLIIRELENGILEHSLLRFLLIITEKAADELAEKARTRFEQSWVLLSEMLDINDIINTKYVGKFAYASDITQITLEQFLDRYNRDLSRPITREVLKLHWIAAERFENIGLPDAALRSYGLLFAASVAEAQRNLNHVTGLLFSNGGGALAEQLSKAFGVSG